MKHFFLSLHAPATSDPVISFFGCRAGETFCQMACGMLFSIGDFLRMGIDEIVKNMYELSDNDEDEDMATR